ncbi:Oxoglutarate/iron-dependent dioxygenase [Arabidopsis suecica]|uniref:Oxoglutarate/iron-dependent dioxygenase n=1 Tax=Arabidopsis suecica TaxID=45249 RepID=A0A8T2BDP5_ARASU|nr:Oxoglutarate/iron-dependent dioxygenase [Arabidopsis suecica]
MEDDPFLRQYQPSELKIVSEFLTNWLPFLSKDLCKDCNHLLSNRIRSLDPEHCCSNTEKADGECKTGSGSVVGNMGSERVSNSVDDNYDGKSENGEEFDNHSLGSWKESEIVFGSISEVLGSVLPSRPAVVETAIPRMSWADMTQEDEFEDDEEEEEEEQKDLSRKGFDASSMKTPEKPKLSRDQRENLRLMNVKRTKDFICLERVKGKIVNVLDGLELHTGVFSAVEQKRIVDLVYQLQEKGRKGELKKRTFTAPHKWMRGKGRETIQFGCCYNYAPDRAGNPPGILQREEVDPLPPFFKVIIRRLIKWHVLPPTCVPDSCIVNIYDEGDCIPPHIDNHDFLRPFCTISFLSECDILFGSNLKVEGPGEFSGSYSIPLPVGSVLVLNGNGADVAKHCVPAVPTKRISITFRKMDESKRPVWFTPEPDLQGIEPLPLELNHSGSASRSSGLNNHNNRRGHGRRGGGNSYESRGYYNPERSSEHNDSGDWPSSQRRGMPRPSRRN